MTVLNIEIRARHNTDDYKNVEFKQIYLNNEFDVNILEVIRELTDEGME